MPSIDEYEELKLDSLDDETSLLIKYRYSIVLVLIGLIFSGTGLYVYQSEYFSDEEEIQIINAAEREDKQEKKIVAEIAGAVNKPGVYELPMEARVGDLIVLANGLSDNADQQWIARTINQAARLNDGQKVYIPDVNQQSNDTSDSILTGGEQMSATTNGQNTTLGVSQTKTVNINSASQSELESLWGIGPVTAKNIIEQRPYSSVEQLLNKKILKSNVYERNRDLLTIY